LQLPNIFFTNLIVFNDIEIFVFGFIYIFCVCEGEDSLCKIQFEERNREHKRTEHNAILGYRISSTRTNNIYSYANVSISIVDKITYL
jgi:hypothetical protein